MNPGERKDDLHRLVDTLPEEKTEAAKRFLELLLGDGAVFLPERPETGRIKSLRGAYYHD